MVGEDTPVTTVDPAAIDATTAAFDRQTEAVGRSNEMFGIFDATTKTVSNVLTSLSNKLTAAGVDLKNLGDPASSTSAKFGLLATAVVGATESFKGLSAIDSGNLSTFTEQLTETSNILLSSGTAGSAAKAALGSLVNTLGSLGRPTSEINSRLKEGIPAFLAYAKNILTSADNGLRLQNAFIQLTASTGNLGTIMRDAGEDLSNMNALLAKQSEMLAKAGEDTKLSAGTLQQYWAQLGTIPGVLEEMTVNLNKGDESLNILTASVQLATGTGRKYADVISDLRKAVTDYGLSTSQAFTFTARVAELSQKFKAPIDDVRKALLDSAAAFRTFADAGDSSARQADGFAKIMNNYVGALKQTGLSAHSAVSLVGQMTDSLKGLSIEQKAFLSQQTGGPGGLQGGFQIEKMLREGKIDEVFEKVRQQMQKQFGRIVTLNEASSSPAAALQLEKQMQLLQKGPLGGFAKTDQDAFRILEAFRGVQDGRRGIQGLSQTAAADQVAKGAQVQNLSNTPLSSLRSTLESIRYTVNIANLSTTQKALTAGAGIPLADTDTLQQKNMRANLAQRNPTDVNATVGTMAGDAIAKMQDWFRKLPETSKAVMQGFGQAISSGKQENINAAANRMAEEIQADKNSKESKLKQQALDTLKNTTAPPKTSMNVPFKPSTFSSLDEATFGEPTAQAPNAGAMVGQAARTGAATVPAPVAPNTATSNTIPNKVASNEEMNFKVNVNAICSVCKHTLETSEQSRAVNPTAGT